MNEEEKFCKVIETLIEEIERLKKYEKFAKHIFEHKNSFTQPISEMKKDIDDWVMCKICDKTINEINAEKVNKQ